MRRFASCSAAVLLTAAVWGAVMPSASGQSAVPASSLAPPTVRRYEDSNGTIWQETRTRYRKPVSETKMVQREETIERDSYTTEIKDSYHTTYTPVTQYRWEPRWHGRWNPFQSPRLVYHWMPVKAWQAAHTPVQVPVTTRTAVPERRLVQVPVTTLKFVDDEQVSRVPIGTRYSQMAAAPGWGNAARTPGGDPTGRMANRGAQAPGFVPGWDDSGWRASR